MAESDARRALLKHRRQVQLETMAAFCRFWRMTPAEYKALTIEELDALTKHMNNEIVARNRANKKR